MSHFLGEPSGQHALGSRERVPHCLRFRNAIRSEVTKLEPHLVRVALVSVAQAGRRATELGGGKAIGPSLGAPHQVDPFDEIADLGLQCSIAGAP